MVNGVDLNYTAGQVPQQAYMTAPQQVTTAGAKVLDQKPDTFLSTTKSAASSAALFEGIPLLNLLRRSKKATGKTISKGMKLIGIENKTALKQLLHGEGKLSQRILDFISSANKSKQAYMAERSSVKALNKVVKANKNVAKATTKLNDQLLKASTGEKGFILRTKIKKFGKNLLKFQNKATKAEAKAAEKATEAATARTVINTTQAAGKLGKVRNILKSSGAGIMLVFSGIYECFSEVIPTFKELGAKKGIKQVGKSAIKVVGDTVGYIGGEQVGVALGTAIGTAIFPGVGTVVGAVCGIVGGLVGSWAMGKVTKAITGKTEREIAKEQQTPSQEELQNNPFEQLNQVV